MPDCKDIDQSTLLSVFQYDKDTGELSRRTDMPHGMYSDGQTNRINSRHGGTSVLSASTSGGHVSGFSVKLFRNTYKAHRVIWIMVNGSIDSNKVVDHINGDPTDNRLRNLRLISRRENSCNRKPNKSLRHGVKGVRFDKRTGRWISQVVSKKKNHYGGSWDTKGMAAVASAKLSLKLHGKFSHYYKKSAAL